MSPYSSDDILREIAQSISTASGEEFFGGLVMALCRALEVDFAFIGQLDSDDPDRIHIIAVCIRGKIAENFSYHLHGTPCENVVGREPCHYPRDIQSRFPEDTMLAEMGIESYVGYPLFGSAQQSLGLLAVMHGQPMPDEEPVKSVLKIFSARAAAEIERIQVEETLRASEANLRALAENAGEGILVNREGRHVFANRRLAEMLGYRAEELLQTTIKDIVHPDEQERVTEMFRKRIAGHHVPNQYETVFVAKDGRAIPVEINSAATVWQGTPAGLVFVRDITERKRADAEMRRLSSAIEQTADSVVITDRDGIIQYINPAYETTTGFSREEALGKKPNIVKSGKHEPAFYQRLWDTVLRGEVFRDVFINRRKNGDLYHEQKTITPLKNEKGNITHFVSTGKDITERKKAEDALRASEEGLAHAQRIAHLGNWNWNIATGELHWSDEIYRIFGLTPQELSATYEAFLNSVHPDDRQFVIDAVNKTLHEKQPYSIDHRIVLPDGAERIVHEQAEVTFDADGKPIRMTGTVQDITERKDAEARLNYLAHYDTLTGLPNRVLLYDRLNQVMTEADRNDCLVAVMFLDLDRFKIINDTLGHDVGDALLKIVAERMTGCVRTGDTISRLGGDEFTVVLANVAHVNDVARVAQKIIDSFVPPFSIDGRELFMSPSIGITLYPFDDNNIESLMRNADAAMYHAKETGRNTFQFYTAELNRRTAKRLTLETALRHALERDELLLQYQPQVNLKTGRIIGMEALLRWQHPEMGLVPPLDFIPLAEETGLIIPIGEWVLRTACAQTRAWRDAGFRNLQMAVNISGRQLQHRGLAKVVKKALRETGLDPRQLDLELTESLLMHNTGETLAVMDELHTLGVIFSMDDFGTGYSSLSYLKRFPIDTIKIDQSFVRDIPRDPDDAAIAQAIIAIAHSLGMKVIAEGVETAKQLAFMRSHKCDGMQGYYFSKPVQAEAITKLLQKDRRLTARRTRRTAEKPRAKKRKHLSPRGVQIK